MVTLAATPRRLEFRFDFGSPYSFLAHRWLQSLERAGQLAVTRVPMLLGGVFQATGNHSPAQIPAKALWMRDDLTRWAARIGTPFRFNPHFPQNTLVPMRGAVALENDPDAFGRYVDAVFTAAWEDEQPIGDPATLLSVVAAAGLDSGALRAAVADPAVKERLKRLTEEAVARGVFGAPTFFFEGAMHWGMDRLILVEDALARVPATAAAVDR